MAGMKVGKPCHCVRGRIRGCQETTKQGPGLSSIVAGSKGRRVSARSPDSTQSLPSLPLREASSFPDSRMSCHGLPKTLKSQHPFLEPLTRTQGTPAGQMPNVDLCSSSAHWEHHP